MVQMIRGEFCEACSHAGEPLQSNNPSRHFKLEMDEDDEKYHMMITNSEKDSAADEGNAHTSEKGNVESSDA